MAPLDLVRERYERRHEAATAVPDGARPLVGTIGNLVPVEPVLATGGSAVMVIPRPEIAAPMADRYLDANAWWEERSLLEALLRGDFQSLDLLVLTRRYEHLYYYLKELVRRGDGALVPPLYLYDLIPRRQPAVRAYNWGRTRDLVERIERAAGAPLADERLRGAIDLINRRRAALRRLQELRWQGALAGSDALRLVGAGYVVAPEEYVDLLEAALDGLRPDPHLRGRPRLLALPADPLPTTSLHDALEASGGLVVAEDDWWGSRAATADIETGGDPLAAISEHTWLGTFSHDTFPREAREAWFRAQAVRPDVDGVVLYVPPSDQRFGWDYPSLKAWLDERGVPSLLVRDDADDPASHARISAAASAFITGLRTGSDAVEQSA